MADEQSRSTDRYPYSDHAVGLLIGWMVAWSSTPIVADVVTALVAVSITASKSSKSAPSVVDRILDRLIGSRTTESTTEANAARLAQTAVPPRKMSVFVLMFVGLIAGQSIRGLDVLSDGRIYLRYHTWKTLTYSEESSRELVRAERFGVNIDTSDASERSTDASVDARNSTSSVRTSVNPTVPVEAGMLMAGEGGPVCRIDRTGFIDARSTTEQIGYLTEQSSPAIRELAEAVLRNRPEAFPTDAEQRYRFLSILQQFCPDAVRGQLPIPRSDTVSDSGVIVRDSETR